MTMNPNFDQIDKKDVRELAIEIYTSLFSTGKVENFEIVANDIFCQLNKNGSFSFSVEVRKDEAEFFLFDMNFIILKENSFQDFKMKILDVIDSVKNGNYQIE